MKEIVFDASTLILLAKIELLREISDECEVVVSSIVAEEATRKKELVDSQMVKNFIHNGIIHVKEVKMKQDLNKLLRDFNMDAGEASSLLLAKEKKALLATDDKVAIKVCKIFGVPFTTAITFLLRVYEKKILTRSIAVAKINKLEKFGRYAPQIINDALKRIKGGA